MAIENVELGDIIEYIGKNYLVIEISMFHNEMSVWLYDKNNPICGLCGATLEDIKNIANNIELNSELVKYFDNQLTSALEDSLFTEQVIQCQQNLRKKYAKWLEEVNG